jgi:hypothetical protein
MPLLANLIIETFQPTPDASWETICRALNHGAPGGPDGWFSMAAPSPSELPVRTLRAWSRCCRCRAARAAREASIRALRHSHGAFQAPHCVDIVVNLPAVASYDTLLPSRGAAA